MLEIVNKNVFNIMTMPNNLEHICKFYHHNLVFSSFCTIHEKICFLQKIWFLKNSTRVVKYESWVVKLNPAWLSRFWWKFNYSAPDPHKLFTLVKTYQIHFHSSICRKYKENKWRFSFGHFFRNRTIISKPLNDGLSSEQNMTN